MAIARSRRSRHQRAHEGPHHARRFDLPSFGSKQKTGLPANGRDVPYFSIYICSTSPTNNKSYSYHMKQLHKSLFFPPRFTGRKPLRIIGTSHTRGRLDATDSAGGVSVSINLRNPQGRVELIGRHALRRGPHKRHRHVAWVGPSGINCLESSGLSRRRE